MRIDPSREQRFQPLVDARQAEAFLHQRVEAERRQVPFIEDDRVAQRDRLAVVRLPGEQIEQRARSSAVAPIPRLGGRTVENHPRIVR